MRILRVVRPALGHERETRPVRPHQCRYGESEEKQKIETVRKRRPVIGLDHFPSMVNRAQSHRALNSACTESIYRSFEKENPLVLDIGYLQAGCQISEQKKIFVSPIQYFLSDRLGSSDSGSGVISTHCSR